MPEKVNTETIQQELTEWLLQQTEATVHFLTLRDIQASAHEQPEVQAARRASISDGIAGRILDSMQPEGWWAKAGAGYSPKYRSSVWALIALAQLGHQAADDLRLQRAVQYYLSQALTENSGFSYNGKPEGTLYCLHANMCAALRLLGADAASLAKAYTHLAELIVGVETATSPSKIQYVNYVCGPGFACRANGKLPCSWAAVKALWAFGSLSESEKTPLIQRAIQQTVNFVTSSQLDFTKFPVPKGKTPSLLWQQLDFPLFYPTDLLQAAQALVDLGWADHPAVLDVHDWVLAQRNPAGLWNMQPQVTNKIGGSWQAGKPSNPWVSWRVLHFLRTLPA